MTSSARRVVYLLTGGEQFVHREFFVRLIGCSHFQITLLLQPRGIVFFGLNFDNNRHEAVIFSAQFSALATVHTGFFNTNPRFVNESWDCVFLHGKVRDPPRVNHVIGRDQKTNFLVGRNNQRVINFE